MGEENSHSYILVFILLYFIQTAPKLLHNKSVTKTRTLTNQCLLCKNNKEHNVTGTSAAHGPRANFLVEDTSAANEGPVLK